MADKYSVHLISEQEQADRQVGGHFHWAVELEQGPHGLPLVPTMPVVFSF
jgi:hypothetical protein